MESLPTAGYAHQNVSRTFQEGGGGHHVDQTMVPLREMWETTPVTESPFHEPMKAIINTVTLVEWTSTMYSDVVISRLGR